MSRSGLLLTIGTFALIACSSHSSGPAIVVPADGGPPECVPGASVACTCTNGASGAQLCQASGTLGTCVCSGSNQGGTSAGTIAGTVSVIGGLDPSGVKVTLSGSGEMQTATTNADGGYSLTSLPAGAFALRFDKTETLPTATGLPSLAFGATLPQLIFLPGSNGFIVDGEVYPFGSIELPAASQVFASSAVESFAVTQDGSTLAFLVPTSSTTDMLVAVPVAGGSPITLADDASAFQLSPDSQHVLYETSNNTLILTTTAGATGVQLVTNVWQAQFSTDGRSIEFSTDEGQVDPYVVPISGGTPTAAAPPGSYPEAFSPDASHIAYLQDYQNLMLAATSSGAGPVSLGVASNQGGQAQFSPDGSLLAFLASAASSPESSALQIVSVASPAQTSQLSAAGELLTYLSMFSFSPDGSHVAYLSYQPGVDSELPGELELVTSAGGTEPVLLGSGVPWGSGFAFTSDSASIVFITTQNNMNTGTLQVAPVAGGSAVTLAMNVQDFVLSPDGTTVAFLSNPAGGIGTLSTVSVSGGTPTQLDANAAGNFRFSPDGARVAYLAGNTNTLMIVPSAGGMPVVLNDSIESSQFAGNALASLRTNTAAPLGFLDGVYVTPLP